MGIAESSQNLREVMDTDTAWGQPSIECSDTTGDGHSFLRKQDWKTCRPFSRQTKGKHVIILLSVCIQNWKTVWFFVFLENRKKTNYHQAFGGKMFAGCFPRKQ